MYRRCRRPVIGGSCSMCHRSEVRATLAFPSVADHLRNIRQVCGIFTTLLAAVEGDHLPACLGALL